MNLIDHRILIPTSPERVWHFVGELTRNPEWQVNVEALSMLTSNPKPGPGTRLRLNQRRGRDQVWEVTAWYERFGYEYHVVEGSPFRENKGQLRLQEVAEGTIVQWTFNYSGGGLFGGGGKAQEQIIVDSLKALYKLITRSKEVETFQAKSLMRDDPGVEARANYRPRHSTSIPTESGEGVRVPKSPYAPPTPGKPIPAVPVQPPAAEPPSPFAPPAPAAEVKLSDTRPHPVVSDPAPPVTPPPAPEPVSFAPPVVTPEPVKPAEVEAPPAPAPVVEPAKPEAAPEPVQAAPPPVVAPEPVKPTEVQTPPVPVVEPVKPEPAPEPVQAAPPVAQTPAPPAEPAPAPVVKSPSRDKLSDTSQISVFDIFGLPKPSQTQPMAPIDVDEIGESERVTPVKETPAPAAEPVISASAPVMKVEAKSDVPAPHARAVGRRALMRRQHKRVRPRFGG